MTNNGESTAGHLWPDLAAAAAEQHGVISRAQVSAAGLSRQNLRTARARGQLMDAGPRVYRFAGAPWSWRARLCAATLTGAGAVASHRAAAMLHRLDGIDEAPIEVTVARGQQARLPTAIVHCWTDPDPADHVVLDGIRTTNLAVTLAQLGAVVSITTVERALDDALRRGTSLRWISDTASRLERPGPSGTGKLIRLLDDPVRQGAVPDSAFERITQRILTDPRIPEPELQYRIDLGDRQVRIDLAWPRVKYGVECHSRTYHFGPAAEEADNVRDHALGAAGWHLDYVTWHETGQPDVLVDRIVAVYHERSRQLTNHTAA